jgi:5'-nucleotidase
MGSSIVISDEKKFSELREKFILGDFSDLCVISDFDRTLTKCFVNDKMVPSLISVLRDENMLVSGYSEKAQALFKKFHAIEVDDSLSIAEKIPFMEQWWGEHGQLLVDSGLNKKDLENICRSSNIVYRNLVFECINLLNLNNVPFVVLSASGAGVESVEYSLDFKKLNLSNVFVISNRYVWDEKGFAIERVKPYIHTFNKSGSSIIENKLVHSNITGRKNVILLGDSLGDCHMADGLIYDNVLKIGFLNSDVGNKLRSYKSHYDVVITGDCEFDFVYNFLKELK